MNNGDKKEAKLKEYKFRKGMNFLKKQTTGKPSVAVLMAGVMVVCFFLLFMIIFLQNNSGNSKNGKNINMEDTSPDDLSHDNLGRGKSPEEHVIHKTIKTKINGLEQVINILEISPGLDKVKIKPVLAHESVFGFEFLSEMAEKHNAYAAINGGFFYEYGNPSGMVVIDGEVITASSGKYPVFVYNRGKAELREIESKLLLKSEENILELNGINVWGKAGDWVLFTRRYGTTNRIPGNIGKLGIILVIKNNIVTGIIEDGGETEIPQNGMLLTLIAPKEDKSEDKSGNNPAGRSGNNGTGSEPGKYGSETSIPFSLGERVEFLHLPDLGEEAQAYECGSWIIKDGEIVIGSSDPWVGTLTNRDPRTAIGIKENGEVVLFTIDGRQPEYSYGFTGRELGEYLLEYGVKFAAMLDGGASTEMIVKGKMVNRPSYRGEERPLAGGLIVEVTDD